MATRIGLAQQTGESNVEVNTICYSAAVSTCEESHEWQLALGLLSRMAEQGGSERHLLLRVATRTRLAQRMARPQVAADSISFNAASGE